MKTIKLFRVVVILLGIFLSACGAQAVPDASSSTGGGKPQASEVAFTGVIESMDGDQWVINGQTVTVAGSAVKDGPFRAGDTVKVEARVEADGSVVALRVETPSAADLANDNSNDDNSNGANANDDNSINGNGNVDNSNDANSNDANSNDANSNDDNGNGNGGDESFGTVDAISDTSITVNGQTYQLAPGAEIKGQIDAGMFVKLHLIVNADGTISIREVEAWDPTQVGNGNDDNSNDDNGNDDNGNDNSNDDDDDNDDHNGNNNSNDDDDDDDDDDSNSNGGNGNGG